MRNTFNDDNTDPLFNILLLFFGAANLKQLYLLLLYNTIIFNYNIKNDIDNKGNSYIYSQ